jgi:hypothetical protein
MDYVINSILDAFVGCVVTTSLTHPRYHESRRVSDMYKSMLSRVVSSVGASPMLNSKKMHALAVHYTKQYYMSMSRDVSRWDITQVGTPATIYMLCFRLAFSHLEDRTLSLRRIWNLPRVVDPGIMSETIYGLHQYVDFYRMEWHVIQTLDFGSLPELEEFVVLLEPLNRATSRSIPNASSYQVLNTRTFATQTKYFPPVLTPPRPSAIVTRLGSSTSLC